MSVRREITVTRKGLIRPIDIVQGTDLIPFEFVVTDFTIPLGAAVVVYNKTGSETTRKQLCDVIDNAITFTPESTLFDEGKNVLQLRVTYEEKNLFSFEIIVNSSKAPETDDAEEVEKQPTLVTQLLTKIGNLFKAVADEATERKNADAAEESARKEADAREKAERQAEIAVERARINQFVALEEGSTTGDAELMDIRIGGDGVNYASAGLAVRGQFSHVESIIGLLPSEKCAVTPKVVSNTAWIITEGIAQRTEVTSSTAFRSCNPIEFGEAKLCEVNVNGHKYSDGNCIIVVDENYNVLHTTGYITSNGASVSSKFMVPNNGKYLLINNWNVSIPTIAFTSYKEVSSEEVVTEIENTSKLCFEKSLKNILEIRGAVKEKNKLWSVTDDKVSLMDMSSNAHIACSEIPVKFGQIITVKTYSSIGSNKNYPFVITDSDYNVLYKSKYDSTELGYVEETVYVPLNSAFLMINAFSTVAYSKVIVKDSNIFDGKTVAIIGDSISTNGNGETDSNAVEMTITEEDIGQELSAYLTYYDVSVNALSLGGHTFTSDEIGTEVTFVPTSDDVGKVIGLSKTYYISKDTTWWEIAQYELGFKAIPVCWSGASITSHESNVSELKCSHAWHESQIRKCGIRTSGSMERTAPDIIIVFRGCNDITHEPYTRLTDGYFGSVNFEYPITDELSDGSYGFKEGYVLLISKLRETYPQAKIFLCTLSMFKRVNCSKFPTNNGINTLPQYNNAIREIADYMGCGLIEFDKCGITFENCYSEGYITDSSTTPTHPSLKGHTLMGNKAIHDLKNQYVTV